MNGVGKTDGRHRVLVLWADEYSSNLGVQALAAGTRALISLFVNDAVVTHASYGDRTSQNLRLTATNLARALARRNRELSNWLGEFDLVVDTGAGDSFADIYGLRRLAEMSTLRTLVRRLAIPLILGPQTIGPFETQIGRWMAKTSVGRDAIVVTRDGASRDVANELLKSRVLYATDVVFLLPVNRIPHREGILLNVSGLLWEKNPHVDFGFYREEVLRLAEMIQDAGKQLTLLSHVTNASHADNDIEAVNSCRNLLSLKPEAFHPSDLEDVRMRIAGSEIVVASRMHAVLNALSQGVPAVGWSYSRKFKPLLGDVGWPHLFDLKERKRDTAPRTFDLIEQSNILTLEAERVQENARNRIDSVVEELRVAVVPK